MEKSEKNTLSYRTKSSKDKKVDANEVAEINSRVFLPSAQCMGNRSHYLFAFGSE